MKTLEQRIEFLEGRVAQLEAALQRQVRITSPYQPIGPGITETPWNIPKPYTPKSSPDHPDNKRDGPFPDPIVPWYDQKNKCPKCGLVCEGAMGYCCPNNPCPMGMGGVTC